MKKLYIKKLGFAVLLLGMVFPLAANYTSNAVSGSFYDPKVWSTSQVPSNKEQTITIVSRAILNTEGSFSWNAKITIQQNAKFTVGSDFSTGHGGIDILGELEVDGKLTGSNGGAAFNVKKGAVVTVNGVADNTNITVDAGGILIVKGSFSLTQTLKIKRGGRVEVHGDFNLKAQLDIEENGVLVVNGSFNAIGNWGMNISGTIVVRDNFSASNGTIYNTGNVVIGGNFTHGGGGFGGTNSENFYIINPDAVITAPASTSVGQGKYGDLGDFINNENDALQELVAEVLPEYVSSPNIIWNGSISNDWFVKENWKSKKVPVTKSTVIIRPLDLVKYYPQIPATEIAEVKDLTIETGATLTLKPGSMLTVNGDLNIGSEGGLVLESKIGPDGLASLITKGEVNGKANVKLDIEGGRWYYLSSAVKTPTFAQLGAADSPFDFRIDIYRKARWISIYPQNGASKLRELEGVSVKNSVIETRRVDLLGELNSGEIIRAFAEGGWHIFGNPYPSAISWRNSEGWTKENILPTIWYRTQIGSEMTFVTYNAESDISSHTPEEANEFYTEGDDFSIIPPYQAVWIRTATNGPASITVDNRVRLHSLSTSTEDIQAPQLKSASTNTEVSKIRISASNRFSRDGSVIYFSDNNAEGFGTEDSEKYFNDSKNIPEVYTRVDTRSLAINGVPTITESVKSIPISVRNRVEGDVKPWV